MNQTKKLFTKDFTLVVIGQIISLFGNAAIRFALPPIFVERDRLPRPLRHRYRMRHHSLHPSDPRRRYHRGQGQ